MRILGLDIGSKTIGVAVSDPLGWTAQGLTTIRRRRLEDDLTQLRQLIEQYQPEAVVCGLPLNMNGSRGPAAQLVEEFGAQLAAQTTARIIYRDERLSTVAAERTLLQGDVSRGKRKQVIDKMAAVFILQGYLDSLRLQGHDTTF